MDIGVSALQVSSPAAKGEAILSAINHLLDSEGDEEAKVVDAVESREGVDSAEGIAGAAGPLEPHLPAIDGPVNADIALSLRASDLFPRAAGGHWQNTDLPLQGHRLLQPPARSLGTIFP